MNKFSITVTAAALLFLVITVEYVRGQRTASAPIRPAWEYRDDVVPGTGDCDRQAYTPDVCDPIYARIAALNSRLINQRAAEGWELAAVGANNFYFKRAK